MAKIWWEPHHGERYRRAPTLEAQKTLCVRVASFTFRFETREQLRECLEFYRQKHHSSSQSSERAAAVRNGEVAWRHEVQRWYERLPLYLREEPKRLKVVAALEEALGQSAVPGFE